MSKEEKKKEKGKYHRVVDTMDGIIDEWWDAIPPYQPKTPEEKAEQLDRIYPLSEDIVSYLRYRCHFCMEKFFLISPYRERGKNPYSEGFIAAVRSKTQDNKNKKIMPVCRSCLLDLCNKRENVWTNHEYDKKD